MPENSWLREELTSEQRTADLDLTIDPGFVHHRKIATVIGPAAMKFVDDAIGRLPDLPEYMRTLRIDRIYTDALVKFCSAIGVPSLLSIVAAGKGTMFCSTVEIEPSPNVSDAPRVQSAVALPGVDDLQVYLEYSTDKIVADTTRSELRSGGAMVVVAQLHTFQDGKLIS